MTQSEKLQKLVDQSISNGYEKFIHVNLKDQKMADRFEATQFQVTWFVRGGYPKFVQDTYSLIFNHDFAKALFPGMITFPKAQFDTLDGERFIEYAGGMDAWQHHLQQAVISEDPISYMYEQVFGNAV